VSIPIVHSCEQEVDTTAVSNKSEFVAKPAIFHKYLVTMLACRLHYMLRI